MARNQTFGLQLRVTSCEFSALKAHSGHPKAHVPTKQKGHHPAADDGPWFLKLVLSATSSARSRHENAGNANDHDGD